MGSAEGRSPFAGGTGVSPGFGFITPFLARKGDGGMVETALGRRRFRDGAKGLREYPPRRRTAAHVGVLRLRRGHMRR